MNYIYLINVGANTAHQARARSPRFPDNSFSYVSFFTTDNDPTGVPYPEAMWPFVLRPNELRTHPDPDWENLTYGDVCHNVRGRTLRDTTVGDILLFWGLLWLIEDRCHVDFHQENNRGWYLLGAMRVEHIVESGTSISDIPIPYRCRAARSIHCLHGTLPMGERVFVADGRYSTRFEKAVDIGVEDQENGLVWRTFRDHDQDQGWNLLQFGGQPAWYSALRRCRRMWNLANPEQRALAEIVRRRILDTTHFDILRDIG